MEDKESFLKPVPFNSKYVPDNEVMLYVGKMENFGSDVKELIIDFFRTTENPTEILRLMQLERRISCQHLSGNQERKINLEIEELKLSLGLTIQKSNEEKKVERIELLKSRLEKGVSLSQQYRITKELEKLEV